MSEDEQTVVSTTETEDVEGHLRARLADGQDADSDDDVEGHVRSRL